MTASKEALLKTGERILLGSHSPFLHRVKFILHHSLTTMQRCSSVISIGTLLIDGLRQNLRGNSILIYHLLIYRL